MFVREALRKEDQSGAQSQEGIDAQVTKAAIGIADIQHIKRKTFSPEVFWWAFLKAFLGRKRPHHVIDAACWAIQIRAAPSAEIVRIAKRMFACSLTHLAPEGDQQQKGNQSPTVEIAGNKLANQSASQPAALSPLLLRQL